MARDVKGKKVAILTENGFEEVELTSPMNALEQAGATVHIISPQKGKVKAWDHDHWSIELPVDKDLSGANPEEYDMLLLPGGVLNPDTLRLNKEAVSFAQHFLEQGKPLAAICHDAGNTTTGDACPPCALLYCKDSVSRSALRLEAPIALTFPCFTRSA